MTIKENLIRAKALIPDEAHWGRGSYHYRLNGEDCYCVQGAIAEARGDEMGAADHSPEAGALRKELPGEWVNLAFFNDFGAKDVSDIHALFDRAIGAQP